jgi:hypothetical protein
MLLLVILFSMEIDEFAFILSISMGFDSYNNSRRYEQKFSKDIVNQYPLHLLKLAEGSNIMV